MCEEKLCKKITLYEKTVRKTFNRHFKHGWTQCTFMDRKVEVGAAGNCVKHTNE